MHNKSSEKPKTFFQFMPSLYRQVCCVYALPYINMVPLVPLPLPYTVEAIMVYHMFKGLIYFSHKMQYNIRGT